MATTATAAALSMKLLIDTKAHRVLFAEASKDVVDFLFSLLALPVAIAITLVGKESMAGSVGNLYAIVQNLDDAYVLPGAAKDALLRPTVVSPPAITTASSFLCPPEASYGQPTTTTFYRCTNPYNTYCPTYVTDVYGKSRPVCYCPMTTAQYPAPADGSGQAAQSAAGTGFVQGAVTCTVLDNLTVAPMSAVSSVTLLNTLAVRDIGDLQERTVQLGYTEVISIIVALNIITAGLFFI